MIEYAGGIKHINDYIHRLSIDSFNLSEIEDGMHSSFEAVYRNWSTPSAMVRLLRTADEKELFSNKELKDFLWQTMIDTETGANKLKGMLPAKTVVGHKTGSSDRNADGMKTADNDAGLVILPDGRKYYIAAFVMDSYETDEDNANIIAAYHAWYKGCDEMREARGLLVAPPISFDTRDILQKSIAVVLVIYAATIMLKPVADNQIIHFQHHVVAGNLVENP